MFRASDNDPDETKETPMTRNLLVALFLGSLSTFTAGCDDHHGGVGRSSANLAQGDACQAKGECGAGLECEIEHGVGTCKPHAEDGAGDDHGQDAPGTDDKGQDAPGTPDDKGQGADDPKKHDDSGNPPLPNGDCAVDADCGPDAQCELEQGVGTCKPHVEKKQ